MADCGSFQVWYRGHAVVTAIQDSLLHDQGDHPSLRDATELVWTRTAFLAFHCLLLCLCLAAVPSTVCLCLLLCRPLPFAVPLPFCCAFHCLLLCLPLPFVVPVPYLAVRRALPFCRACHGLPLCLTLRSFSGRFGLLCRRTGHLRELRRECATACPPLPATSLNALYT